MTESRSQSITHAKTGAFHFQLGWQRRVHHAGGVMQKALLYALAAIGNIAVALFAFRHGRIVIPAVLLFAAICFTIAAIGQALGKGR